MRGAILTILALLTIAPAAAADPVEITGQPYVQRTLIAARFHFRQVPPCQPIRVYVMPAELAPLDGSAIAWAGPEACAIMLSDIWMADLTAHRTFFCNTLVHEFGHIIGRGHDDPDPVMHDGGGADTDGARECLPVPRARAARSPSSRPRACGSSRRPCRTRS